ncbi:MAG: hypothetical protein MHMPM18_004746, partial [Marteilia pararefringens]
MKTQRLNRKTAAPNSPESICVSPIGTASISHDNLTESTGRRNLVGSGSGPLALMLNQSHQNKSTTIPRNFLSRGTSEQLYAQSDRRCQQEQLNRSENPTKRGAQQQQ